MVCQKVKVEVQDREWLEFELAVQNDLVSEVKFRAQGCLSLLKAAERAATGFKGKTLETLEWNSANNHWDQMILEAIARLQGRYELPYKEVELCHCRRVNTDVVERAILLGAHTPEKVKAWTGASGGCGTCRADVINLIDYRVAQKCQKK